MHSDVHARIQAFLQQRSIAPLPRDSASISAEGILKAGVVPFMRHPYRFYLMKPVARHTHLNAPAFQLCKGTRMQQLPTGWVDLREGEAASGQKETLVATGLREGIEELGLVVDGITGLFELGPYAFSSAKTGKERQMWLFAAEIASEGGFMPDSEVAPTTAARKWLNLAQFEVVGRDDHRYILRDIEARLRAHFKE